MIYKVADPWAAPEDAIIGRVTHPSQGVPVVVMLERGRIFVLRDDGTADTIWNASGTMFDEIAKRFGFTEYRTHDNGTESWRKAES